MVSYSFEDANHLWKIRDDDHPDEVLQQLPPNYGLDAIPHTITSTTFDSDTGKSPNYGLDTIPHTITSTTFDSDSGKWPVSQIMPQQQPNYGPDTIPHTITSTTFESESGKWPVSQIMPQQQPNHGLDTIPHTRTSTTFDSDSCKWPVSQIMRLLRFYAAHRCLWDVECDGNHNRKMRQAALIDITAAMGGDLTKDEVIQKINVIRATYRYEKKRIKQRMRKGLGAKTKLKWFALADAFLRKVPKKGHRKEDPQNSDSDLEDAVIFTINPEGLGPLFPQNSFKFVDEVDNVDNHLLQPKVENFLDDSQSSNILGETAMINDSTQANDELPLDSLMKPKLEAVEDDLQEQLQLSDKTMKSLKEEEKVYEEEKPLLDSKLCIREPWTLDTTLQFIQLLKDCPEMLLDSNDIPADTNNEGAALHCIAQTMQRPLKSIEKRLCILKQTYDLEQEKILNNPLYKPPYKWWSEVKTLMESHNELKTESIYLEEENESLSTIPNDIEDDYEIRFENPIPSVAPMSNMNEAMAALFHEEFSLGSNTNSTMPTTETESSHSGKVVWKGLEDDLLEGKWSLKHSVKFLRLYGVHRCLWDLNDPDYRSRPLRNAAIEDIAASMGYGLTATYVAKKIKIFRITYMQQRKRILDAIEKGKCPEILLKWFPLADSFLRPHIGLRSIKSDAKAKEMPQFDFQYVYANLNLIDPALLNDFRGKGSQNTIDIGNEPSMNSDGEEC